MENTNLPTPQPAPVQTEPKKLPMHKGLMAIIILALVAGAAIWVYFILNQPQNLGPVVVPHHPKTISQNQLAATSTPVANSMSDLLTYSNAKYGFEFQYPNTLTYATPTSASDLELDFNKGFTLYINNLGIGFEGMDVISNLSKTINGITLQRESYGDAKNNTVGIVTYEFTNGSNDYLFVDNTDGLAESQFDQIVSTFQFSNQSQTTTKIDTSSWKTYNTPLGFSIQYPPNWTYQFNSNNQTSEQSISFFPPSKAYDPAMEYDGDIVIDVVNNPQNLDLQTFYNNSDNNPSDASTTQTTLTNVNGYPEIKFVGIASMIPSDQISVNLGQKIVELVDVGEQHGDDGITDAMGSSINKH